MSEQAMLSAREVAEWLGCHVNTVKRLGDRGEIPFYRISKRGDRRYRPEDVKAYLTTRWREGLYGRAGQDTNDSRAEDGERVI